MRKCESLKQNKNMFWKSTCDAYVKFLTKNVVNNGELKILYPNLSVKFEDGNIFLRMATFFADGNIFLSSPLCQV